jgi:protein SCO1/2/putative membrane protein
LIVAATVLASLLICLAAAGMLGVQAPARAAQELGPDAFALGEFQLVDQTGKAVTEAEFAHSVWVAAFIFTRCPLSCPRISTVMKGLQGKLRETGVRLVSISVDPEHDTPAVLEDYARRFEADPERWRFLTGPKEQVLALIRERFRLGVEPTSPADQQAGAEAFSHSARLALVDSGRVLGYYDSLDAKSVDALLARAKQVDAAHTKPWVQRLPALNASLNGTCAALLVMGWLLIRARKVRGHIVCMGSAVVVSAMFLACYLVYHFQVGSVPYRGTGPIRLVYFTILLSHTLLATLGVVPLVAVTLTRALRRQFSLHAIVARLTFPIWLYVSITGVVIYLMLYQLSPSATPVMP